MELLELALWQYQPIDLITIAIPINGGVVGSIPAAATIVGAPDILENSMIARSLASRTDCDNLSVVPPTIKDASTRSGAMNFFAGPDGAKGQERTSAPTGAFKTYSVGRTTGSGWAASALTSAGRADFGLRRKFVASSP